MPERIDPNRDRPVNRLELAQPVHQVNEWDRAIDTFTSAVERGQVPMKDRDEDRSLADDVDTGVPIGTRVWRWFGGLWR